MERESSPIVSACRLTLLLGGEGLAVAALHRLGTLPFLRVPAPVSLHEWRMWVRVTPAEDALMASLRLVALLCAWWLLASTLLYLAARLSRRPAAARATGWATLPFVRRTVDRFLAVGLAASLVAGPAAPAVPAAAPDPERVVVVVDRSRGVVLPPGAAPSESRSRPALPAPSPSPSGGGGLPLPIPPDGPAAPSGALAGSVQPAGPDPGGSVATPRRQPAPAGQETYVVRSGDNLWSIAARHLAAASGRHPDAVPDREVHAYWTRVIQANLTTLRSGDPNLIYPGEALRLPPAGDGR